MIPGSSAHIDPGLNRFVEFWSDLYKCAIWRAQTACVLVFLVKSTNFLLRVDEYRWQHKFVALTCCAAQLTYQSPRYPTKIDSAELGNG